jgi:hypothetical protein
MPGSLVVLDHHRCDLSRYHGSFGVGASELLDRLERAPAGNDQELDASGDRAREDRRVDESCDCPQRGTGLAAEVVDAVLRLGRDCADLYSRIGITT